MISTKGDSCHDVISADTNCGTRRFASTVPTMKAPSTIRPIMQVVCTVPRQDSFNTQLFETDAAFHEMCAEFCGNAFFVQAIQYQNRLRRLLEFGSYVDSRRVRDWCREHLAIIEAIAAGDLKQASSRMRVHLEQAFISAQAVAS